MGSRDMKRAFIAFLATVGVFIVVGAVMAFILLRYPERPQGEGHPAAVVIPKGASLTTVITLLERAGVVTRPFLFRIYANHRGVAGKIKAGRYKLSAAASPAQICDALVAGVKEQEAMVTIPEGKNLLEVAQLLEQAEIAPARELVEQARDPQLLHELAVPGPTLEGYLFPDTYRFRPHTPARLVLVTMVRHFQRIYGQLRAAHAKGVETLRRVYKFGDREIVILASIVEKETGAKQERPRIAAVFLNRLRLPSFQPKLLQTDPTIIYGCTVAEFKSAACSKFDGRIRRIHLVDKDNPYNTYTHEGLPPGPISNPGRASLEAVMAPDQTEYLYFVSRNDGTHYFSKTKAEHEAAVTRFQRGGGAQD